MVKPRALRTGDRVAVVAPASGARRESLDAGVTELMRLGFLPTYDETVMAREVFTAGSLATRVAAFMAAWRDPDVRGVVALRGGYGSVQLLPQLAGGDLSAAPKLLIGYSDITSLLSWLTCHCNVPVLHGPMLDDRLARGPARYDEASFVRLARGERDVMLAPDGVEVLQAGEVGGPLFGGTLTQLVGSLGTPYAFDPPPGCLLFIEDVNERPYRLHRMLTQLAQSGVLARASGLIFGEMRGCDEPGGRETARDLVRDFIRGFPGPVIYGFPSGHTTGPCWTLPLGVTVRLVSSAHPAIIVEESVVE